MALLSKSFKLSKTDSTDKITKFLREALGYKAYLFDDFEVNVLEKDVIQINLLYRDYSEEPIDSIAPRKGAIFTTDILSSEFDARILFNDRIDPNSIQSGSFVVDGTGIDTSSIYFPPGYNNYYVKLGLTGFVTEDYHEFRIDSSKIKRFDGSFFDYSPVGGYVLHNQSSAHLGDISVPLSDRIRGYLNLGVVKTNKSYSIDRSVTEILVKYNLNREQILSYKSVEVYNNLYIYFIYVSPQEPQILEGFPLNNSLFPDVSAPNYITLIFSTELSRNDINTTSYFAIDSGYNTITDIDVSDIELFSDNRTVRLNLSSYFANQRVYSILVKPGLTTSKGFPKEKPEQWVLQVNKYEGASLTGVAGVTRLNNFTGEITIEGLGNVNINNSSNTISISGSAVDDSILTGHTGQTGIHYTLDQISITESQISDFGNYVELDLFTGHTGQTGIHYTMDQINITTSQISNINEYTLNENFTGHTGQTGIHYTMDQISITESQISDLGSYTELTLFTGHSGDTSLHFTETSIDHTQIQNIGTNTHAQIDSHIASNSNPHNVTAAQVGALSSGEFTGHTGQTGIHFTEDQINHSVLQNLTADTHPQYILVDGTRAFTNPIAGVTPTLDSHLATKEYVDDIVLPIPVEDLNDLNDVTTTVSKTGVFLYNFTGIWEEVYVSGRSGISLEENGDVITIFNPDFDVVEPTYRFWDGGVIGNLDLEVYVSGSQVYLDVIPSTSYLTAFYSGELRQTANSGTQTIQLTTGTSSNPIGNYIYGQYNGTNIVLTGVTTDWPNLSYYVPIAYILVEDLSGVSENGPYLVSNWATHLNEINGDGHLTHIDRRIRKLDALWYEGTAPSNYTNTGTTGYITIDPGTVYQLHQKSLPAYDSRTSGLYIPNHPTSGYYRETNLSNVTYDSNGDTISNNNYATFVLWGVAAEGESVVKYMWNLPRGSYSNLANATADIYDYSNYSIPIDFDGAGFLVAEYLLQKNPAGGWTQESITDLRGLIPVAGVGGGGNLTDHSLLQNLTSDDHTQYILVDGSRGFTGPVSGATPTESGHLSTKAYVDSITVSGLADTTIANLASGHVLTHNGIQWLNDYLCLGNLHDVNNNATTENDIMLYNNSLQIFEFWSSDYYKSGVLQLNNVENTALSTWTGSTNINILGTISEGAWEGTPIQDSYVANDITLDDIKQITTRSHADLQNLTADDHTHYILVNGTRSFTGPVSGSAPTENAHLATKLYVDQSVNDVLTKNPTSNSDNSIVAGADIVPLSITADITQTNNLFRVFNSVAQKNFFIGSDAKPYAVDATSYSGLITYNQFTGHTGASDPHSVYLLADGTRSMAGTLDMGTNLVSNVANPLAVGDAVNLGYLAGIIGLYMARANSLSDVQSVPDARNNLGLGTAAVEDVGTLAISGEQITSTGASNGQVLTADGAGGSSWEDAAGGSSTFNVMHLLMTGSEDIGGVNTNQFVINWGEILESGSAFLPSGDTGIQVLESGRYVISAAVGWENQGANRIGYLGYVRKNGTEDIKRCASRNYSRGAGYSDGSNTVYTELVLASGDFIEVVLEVDDTDSAGYVVLTITGESEFFMRKL